jgi:hypothetical protein
MRHPPNGFPIDPVIAEIDEEARRALREHRVLTRLQARQLAWLKRWSRTENRERLRGYFIDCYDCGTKDCQHVASVAARVLLDHAGHDTWIHMIPGSKLPREWW